MSLGVSWCENGKVYGARRKDTKRAGVFGRKPREEPCNM